MGLRVKMDVNGKQIGELQIVRDANSFGAIRNYNVLYRLEGEGERRGRVEGFDNTRGPWALVYEALEATLHTS